MTVLHYKNYQGLVTFSDGVLLIKVLHISDSLTTECDSASAAQAAFEDLIEDYLDTCSEVGREPDRPYKGSFNVRVSCALHKSAAMSAVSAKQSLNTWITSAIQEKIERDHPSETRNYRELKEILLKRNSQTEYTNSDKSTLDPDLGSSSEEILTTERFFQKFHPESVKVKTYEH